MLGPPTPSTSEILLVVVIFIALFALIFLIAGFILRTSWQGWIKGAVIGLETYVVFVIYSYLAEAWSCKSIPEGYGNMCGLFTGWVLVIFWILIPVFALISLIYSKIKSEKRQ